MKKTYTFFIVITLLLGYSCEQKKTQTATWNQADQVNKEVENNQKQQKLKDIEQAKYFEIIDNICKTRQNFTCYQVVTVKNKHSLAINSIKFKGNFPGKVHGLEVLYAIVNTYIAPGATKDVIVDFHKDKGCWLAIDIENLHFTDDTSVNFE